MRREIDALGDRVQRLPSTLVVKRERSSSSGCPAILKNVEYASVTRRGVHDFRGAIC